MTKLKNIVALLALMAGLLSVSPASAATTNMQSTTTASKDATVSTQVSGTVVAPSVSPKDSTAYRQLSGLVVTNVNYIYTTGPMVGPMAVITAMTEVRCAEGSIVCPAMPTYQYQIYVWSSTQILDVNRKAMAFEKIQQGDHINAYGRMRDNSSMDASIVRDTDYSTVSTPIQLEDLTVASVDSNSNGAVTLTATGVSNTCYHFPSGRKMSTPCPMALTKDMTTNTGVSSQTSVYSRPTKYSIVIPANATVLDASRRAIKASSIHAGDTINVYGTIASDRVTVTAQIVRVTRRGPSTSAMTIVVDGKTGLTRNQYGIIPMSVSGGTGSSYSWYVAPDMGATPSGSNYGLPRGMSITTDYPYPACSNTTDQVCYAVDPLPTQAWIVGRPIRRGTYFANIGVRDTQSGVTATAPVTIVVQ